MAKKSKKFEKTKISVSLDKWVIEPAKMICEELGLPFDVAINVYLYQLVYTRSIPFPIVLPSEKVLQQCELYRKIAEAEEDVKAGRLIPADEAFAHIRETLQQKISKQANTERKDNE